ncbi:MAG: hypothetical protein EOP53_23760 [Sphingobacteriales bacterium]|nr:MAG: hypothetical protein EOP53_23760 [Sphingobacteriales bacterium]
MLIISGLSACYYDKEEELYPKDTNSCDTVNVSYSKTVLPMLQNQCYVCHSAAAGQGNVVLEGFDKLKIFVDNGKFFGAISHSPGYSMMPQGGNKLPECTLNQIHAWINKGAPNN